MSIRIKQLVLEMIERFVPDFHEVSTKRKGYWFRCDEHRPYYSFIVVGSSQKSRVLDCDVAWGFFPAWDGAYGTHQMRASTGLPNLRLGSSAIPMDQSYYEHDGTIAGIQQLLNVIGADLLAHALPWFRTNAREAGADQLLQYGLRWIHDRNLEIPATIQNDLSQAFAQASYVRSRVKLPILDALKRDLRAFAAKIESPSWQRKETGILAQHLLNYAGEIKRESV